ncbi:MAG: division/cell wall cluster transcriptional repressor MraZ [Candidatus Levybacteria bacterium CG10_big_fil_rev_8_21_14_0_10_36_7]|nr:MAG: division/cell wall cluster transcriptional repressor MraZ [Candidatus Levybacteria bacterium CG10_big_fil_rev_8_21_14_0_10_36_7]
MVFYGEYQVTITSGGRVALPKKIREILSENNLVITKGFGTCLAGYDKKDWEKRAEALLDVSLLEKEEIGKRRMLFSSTIYLEIDDQGRVVLPKQLREFAGVEKKVTINGVGDHFELWNPESWDRYIQDIDK